jgi:(1->4)-alpha-D-glucan 1-alpha-D-glucosylmutase
VRARLNILSELAETFARRVTQWSDWNARHKREVDGKRLPDGNQEWMIYQTLLGAWPLDPGEVDAFRKRLSAFIEGDANDLQRRRSNQW